MLQKIRKQHSGFTIIEVLIVLAIAGLILLIVFLAVPALQRNSRNTQYRNAAAAVLGGVSEYVNNNNGQLPTDISGTGTITISGGGGSAAAQAKVQGGFTASLNNGVPGNTGNFHIAVNRKCNATGTGLDAAVTARAFSALYLVETGSGTAPQCTES